MDYKQKYLKYKNKYLELKNIYKGGYRTNFEKIVKECNYYDNVATKEHDNTVCPKCVFTNSGNNKIQNFCQKIDGNVDKCFYNNTIDDIFNADGTLKTPAYRMDIQKFLDGHSTFTVENNINITPPEGEVCFGNTITSCLTLCIIFNNNLKISLHINPVTTLFAQVFNEDDVLNCETINPFNITSKIMETTAKTSEYACRKPSLFRHVLNFINTFYQLFRDNFYIKKIILLGAYQYNIYQTSSGIDFICDKNAIQTGNTLTTKSIQQFLNENLIKYINPSHPYTYVEKYETIQQGAIYFVKADGVGIIYDTNNNIRGDPF